MKNIKNLLIDLDGTLINLNEKRAHLNFLIHAIFWTGFQSNPIRIFSALSYCKKIMRYDISNELIYNKAVNSFAKKMGIEQRTSEALLNLFTKIHFHKLKKYFSINYDAINFIEWSKDKYNLFLATNPFWTSEIVQLRLSWSGLDTTIFKNYSHSKNMKYSKYSLLYFPEFLANNNISGNECLMIGNKPEQDGLAAKVGAKVFILSNKNFLNHTATRNKKNFSYESGNYQDLKNYLERQTSCS